MIPRRPRAGVIPRPRVAMAADPILFGHLHQDGRHVLGRRPGPAAVLSTMRRYRACFRAKLRGLLQVICAITSLSLRWMPRWPRS
jgi:hypothetical protein